MSRIYRLPLSEQELEDIESGLLSRAVQAQEAGNKGYGDRLAKLAKSIFSRSEPVPLRCRATGRSSNIWSVQCKNPAKAFRLVGSDEVAVCGVHKRSRYVSVYVRSSSKYESDVQEVLR